MKNILDHEVICELSFSFFSSVQIEGQCAGSGEEEEGKIEGMKTTTTRKKKITQCEQESYNSCKGNQKIVCTQGIDKGEGRKIYMVLK